MYLKKYSFVFIYVVLMALPSAILLSFSYKVINLHALLLLIIISLVIGGVLEIISVKQGKKDKFYIWEYNSKTTLDKKILGVAVEDMILFLILTPIFSISAWEAIKLSSIINNTPIFLTLFIGLGSVICIYYLTYAITKPKLKLHKHKIRTNKGL